MIPYLANATKPDDLDFAAAQCDIAPGGEQMACRFRQVFLTIASIDPTTCILTSNGYEQTFRRESATRWVSTAAPGGECGIVDTTTLDDAGGIRWTMTVRRVATRNATPVIVPGRLSRAGELQLAESEAQAAMHLDSARRDRALSRYLVYDTDTYELL